MIGAKSMKKVHKKAFPSRARILSLALVLVMVLVMLLGGVTAQAARDRTAPAMPTSLAATSITQSSVTLAWTRSTDNVGVASYSVYKNSKYVASSYTTAYTVNGLLANTRYSFCVKAKDAAGNYSLASNIIYVTTLPKDAAAPSAPSGLNASSVTSSSLKLAWNASTDNVGVVGYLVYKNGVNVASVSGTSYSASGLTASTAYSFYVKAKDAAGNLSAASSAISVKTAPPPDTTAPSAPSNLAASNITPTSLNLIWTAAADNVGVTGYGIYINSAYITTVTAGSYAATGLTPGTAYSFKVKAGDAAGNISAASNTISVTTPPAAIVDTQIPAAPANLSASSVGSSQAFLNWSASTDDIGVTSYLIYQDGVNIAATADLGYQVTGLSPMSAYSFYVIAKDAAGNLSPASDTLQVTTNDQDTQPPTTPANLTAGTVAENSVTLTWTPSTDDMGIVSYSIYENAVNIGSTGDTTFTVTGLLTNTQYSFYVAAKDAAGNASINLNTITVTTLPPPPPGKVVNGYYAGWAGYSGYTPANIPAGEVTHVTYAFANIGSDLKIALGDSAIDPSNFTRLNDMKKAHPAVKTLISVGGWTWSGRFSDVALTDASRTAFADSIVAFIKKYGFDGVDIDWEYPGGGGLSGNVSRPEDKTNFTLLMAKLREKLDVQGNLDSAHYLLTFAGAAGTSYANSVELSKLAGYVDYATVMTYDMHGAWVGSYTDFNAPLYTPSGTSPNYKWSDNAAIQLWIGKGFPANKITMGVPFYGIRFTGVKNANNGLFQSFTGGGSIPYDQIVSTYLNSSAYVRRYHSEARVPWLFNGSTFISYDDPQSIAEKAAYIKSSGIAGAAIWELSENADGTLLGTLYNGLK